ncbi:hypothetical protein Sxan_33230 [Streptomyces xanthophaeus]|uniref:Uncharacterized protein n=1 Tax=Streptomyces xanthophaeus TaxID=67385 RepID=A0A919H204_9ACTN|nr:hypothetical protein Sxan_33230 [Streptomyces xanthophaeus]
MRGVGDHGRSEPLYPYGQLRDDRPGAERRDGDHRGGHDQCFVRRRKAGAERHERKRHEEGHQEGGEQDGTVRGSV